MNPAWPIHFLIVRVLLLDLIAGLITFAGAQIAPISKLGAAGLLLASVMLAACFAGALTFQRSSPWNHLLFLTSVFLLGLLAPTILGMAEARSELREAAALAIGGLTLAAGASRLLPAGFLTLAPMLWLLSLAYWSGWIALGMAGAHASMQAAWSAGGYVVFWGLAAAWSAGLSRVELEDQAFQKALELYLLVLNLGLSAYGMLKPV